MKKLVYILIICFSIDVYAQNNLVLNGSFELNNSINCRHEFIYFNEFDTTVSFSHDYGDNFTLALLKGYCLTCLPLTYWGGCKKEIIC